MRNVSELNFLGYPEMNPENLWFLVELSERNQRRYMRVYI